MAVNFNQDSVWNLKPIRVDAVKGEVNGLLIGGEEVVMAFQTVRDQLLFTNKRIIAVDVQGITYSKIQYFSIQTPGFGELIPDSELFIMFSNTFTAKFEFKGGVDIGKIGRMISEYVLG